MSRIKQIQNIDRVIQGINTITENRCSLSEEDLKNLNEALNLLNKLKKKKGKTNKETLQVVADVVEMITRFFKD